MVNSRDSRIVISNIRISMQDFTIPRKIFELSGRIVDPPRNLLVFAGHS